MCHPFFPPFPRGWENDIFVPYFDWKWQKLPFKKSRNENFPKKTPPPKLLTHLPILYDQFWVRKSWESELAIFFYLEYLMERCALKGQIRLESLKKTLQKYIFTYFWSKSMKRGHHQYTFDKEVLGTTPGLRSAPRWPGPLTLECCPNHWHWDWPLAFGTLNHQ